MIMCIYILVNGGGVMKKIFILLIILTLLTSCDSPNSKPESQNAYESLFVESQTSSQSLNPIDLSYEEIQHKVDSFFRVFYSENKDYIIKKVESSGDFAESGIVMGFYKGSSLVRFKLFLYNDLNSIEMDYNIIDENLIYISVCDEGLPYLSDNVEYTEKWSEFYIIDNKLWEYSNEEQKLVESVGSHDIELSKIYGWDILELEIYNTSIQDLCGSEKLVIYKNSFSLPTENNQFNQIANDINNYFKNLCIKSNTNKRKRGDADKFEDDCLYINGYYDDVELSRAYLAFDYKNINIHYNYYIINRELIYVNKITEGFTDDSQETIKYAYDEYFIINGVVKKYDINKQDLIDTFDCQNILTLFNNAKNYLDK